MLCMCLVVAAGQDVLDLIGQAVAVRQIRSESDLASMPLLGLWVHITVRATLLQLSSRSLRIHSCQGRADSHL